MSTPPSGCEVALFRLSAYEDLPSFVSRIDDLIAARVTSMVFDLENVAVVNSTLLGFFVKTKRALDERGGGLVLARPTDFVRKTLKTLGLHETLAVKHDIEEAVEVFCRKPEG
jgi:anti-anti-sigma factor